MFFTLIITEMLHQKLDTLSYKKKKKSDYKNISSKNIHVLAIPIYKRQSVRIHLIVSVPRLQMYTEGFIELKYNRE